MGRKPLGLSRGMDDPIPVRVPGIRHQEGGGIALIAPPIIPQHIYAKDIPVIGRKHHHLHAPLQVIGIHLLYGPELASYELLHADIIIHGRTYLKRLEKQFIDILACIAHHLDRGGLRLLKDPGRGHIIVENAGQHDNTG